MPKTLNNVKEDILAVTRKLLFEEGYNKLNMRAIAAKCGIATGTLYNYYKSKQEIVVEVLITEWNMMLRRIEQKTKAAAPQIKKLEVIFIELSTLMNHVHNMWFVDYTSSEEQMELTEIKHSKDVLVNSLKQRILLVIQDDEQDKDYLFLSDVVCKLFISYSFSEADIFRKLQPVLISLLKH